MVARLCCIHCLAEDDGPAAACVCGSCAVAAEAAVRSAATSRPDTDDAATAAASSSSSNRPHTMRACRRLMPGPARLCVCVTQHAQQRRRQSGRRRVREVCGPDGRSTGPAGQLGGISGSLHRCRRRLRDCARKVTVGPSVEAHPRIRFAHHNEHVAEHPLHSHVHRRAFLHRSYARQETALPPKVWPLQRRCVHAAMMFVCGPP